MSIADSSDLPLKQYVNCLGYCFCFQSFWLKIDIFCLTIYFELSCITYPYSIFDPIHAEHLTNKPKKKNTWYHQPHHRTQSQKMLFFLRTITKWNSLSWKVVSTTCTWILSRLDSCPTYKFWPPWPSALPLLLFKPQQQSCITFSFFSSETPPPLQNNL